MIWQWFLIITTFIFLLKKLFYLKTTVKNLQNRLRYLIEDHKTQLDRERALTAAAIDSLAYYQIDIKSVEKEMDRLDVEDFLADIDEENNLFI